MKLKASPSPKDSMEFSSKHAQGWASRGKGKLEEINWLLGKQLKWGGGPGQRFLTFALANFHMKKIAVQAFPSLTAICSWVPAEANRK